MEELIIFRIFLTFPLVGLMIPKAGIILAGGKGYIASADIIIATTLLISIGICSLGILYHKHKLSLAAKEEENIIIA